MCVVSYFGITKKPPKKYVFIIHFWTWYDESDSSKAGIDVYVTYLK